MPFDPAPRDFWDRNVWCKSCKQPIAADEPSEELHFDPCPRNGLEDLNGTYHAACAKPLLSVKRALDMLSWRPS